MFHCDVDNVFQMASFVVNSHLWPFSPTVPVSPEHPSGPPSTCQAHPLFPSVSSAERAARPPAERGHICERVRKDTAKPNQSFCSLKVSMNETLGGKALFRYNVMISSFKMVILIFVNILDERRPV